MSDKTTIRINKATLDLIKRYTNGTFDINLLRGPSYRYCRQQIIESITKQRQPKNVCYISRVRGLLMEALNMYENPKCLAAMERELINKLKFLADER